MTSSGATLAARISAPRRPGVIPGAVLMSSATLVAGVLTYAFHAVVARALGATAYGHIAVLWAAMFVTAVVLFRPVEQAASRSIADRLARGEGAAPVFRALLLLSSLLVVAIVAIGLAAWRPITTHLFNGNGLLTGMLLTGVALYGSSYLVRGLVGGIRWYEGYSLVLIADAIARIAIAAPLVLVRSVTLAGVAVVGAAAAGAVAPLWVGRARLRRGLSADGPRFDIRVTARFVAPAGAIAVADQLFVNGAPLLVIAGGGPHSTRDAGIVFAATMLVRAPVYVFQGLAASLLPNFTHLHATHDRGSLRAPILRTAALLLGIGGATVVGCAAVGPAALRTLFGPAFQADRLPLILLGAGVGLYLAASVISQALLAVGKVGHAAAAWTGALVVLVLVYAATPGASLTRVAIAFCAGAGVALALLFRLLMLRLSR